MPFRQYRFRNPWSGPSTHTRVGSLLRWILIERPRNERRRTPDRATFAAQHPPVTPAFPSPHAAADALVLTWVGHSTFLIQIGGRNILTDPVWGERASPVSWMGPRRWRPPAVDFAALPPIDAVLISHDHYDHLDRPTVHRVIERYPDARWFCPAGVDRWLRARGARDVVARDWWGSTDWPDGDGAVTCVPARHFSGRRLDGRDTTLWCGWVVRSGGHAVLYAGDTGRHSEFGEIGRRLGPFDAVLLPIGAYDPEWFMGPVHMNPEDAVAVYGDVVASTGASAGASRPLFVGMHWGTFQLTDEPMDEPPSRTRAAWADAGRPADGLWIPRHGETRRV